MSQFLNEHATEQRSTFIQMLCSVREPFATIITWKENNNVKNNDGMLRGDNDPFPLISQLLSISLARSLI
jgi:hypothetical protein